MNFHLSFQVRVVVEEHSDEHIRVEAVLLPYLRSRSRCGGNVIYLMTVDTLEEVEAIRKAVGA